MKENILIIGGGDLQLPVIHTVKDMGFTAIVMDMNPNAVGIRAADIPLIIDIKDTYLAVKAAVVQNKLTPIKGVLTVGTDVSVTVALIAQKLKLPGIAHAAARSATNKISMRKILREAGISCPKYSSADSFESAEKYADSIGYPVVVKPVANMGARGVSKAANSKELYNAFLHAMFYSSGNVIIEEYIDGPELSIDAVIYKDEITITGVADRIINCEPYFVELGHTMPSQLPKEQQEQAIEIMKKSIRALGINHGCAKGDIKITPNGAVVGEIAARLSGGYMSTHTYLLSTGVDLMEVAINLAIGDPPGDMTPASSKVAIERSIIADKEGILKECLAPDIRSLKGVRSIILSKSPGSWVSPPKNNVEKLGHIIAVGKTLEEAERIVEETKKYIIIKIED